jgi:hypothetical protein
MGMVKNSLSWARLVALAFATSFCVEAAAQTWIPAPTKGHCGTPATRFQPNPVDTSQQLSVAIGGGQNGKLIEYYTETVANELRLHMRTIDVPLPARECYTLFFPAGFLPPGNYALVFYEYGDRGGGLGFPVTPTIIYGTEQFSVVTPAVPAPTTALVAIAFLVALVMGAAVHKLRAPLALCLFFLLTPHGGFISEAKARGVGDLATVIQDAETKFIERRDAALVSAKTARFSAWELIATVADEKRARRR